MNGLSRFRSDQKDIRKETALAANAVEGGLDRTFLRTRAGGRAGQAELVVDERRPDAAADPAQDIRLGDDDGGREDPRAGQDGDDDPEPSPQRHARPVRT
jgi:hypothetical protein